MIPKKTTKDPVELENAQWSLDKKSCNQVSLMQH